MVVMGVKPSAAFCWILLLFCVHSTASKVIEAKLGKDATLPCEAPDSATILLVEWTKHDLGTEYVFMYRNNKPDLAYQHLDFKNRVELVDSNMKNRNLSIRLNNVTTEDSGTYECHVIQSTPNRRKKRATFNTEAIKTITLNVEDGDSEDGKYTEDGKDKHQHLGVILPVPVIAVVGLVIFKKRKGHSENKSDLPVDNPDVL